MVSNVTFLDPDIFTANECEELIAQGEAMGFEAASVKTGDGPKMLPNVRNNDRVVFDDKERRPT